MVAANHTFDLNVGICVRTLLVNGFRITRADRGVNQIEIRCEREDQLGVTVRYVIALTDLDQPPRTELESLRADATDEGRTVVAIARTAGEGWLAWDEFLDALGGAIPSWRALDKTYENVLITSSRNEDVKGYPIQAWALFEQAVADGFEFILGLRVRRQGGSRRGRRVSDILAETPDQLVLVVDAKASKDPYEMSVETQRQLQEYVKQMISYQKGANPVGAAVVVSRQFAQDENRLSAIANEFLADTRISLSFLPVERLLEMITFFRDHPQLRRAFRWARVFCQNGLITTDRIKREAEPLRDQRIER